LSDLRESGAIEQDADLVLFIYRAEYYKIDVFEDGTPTQGVSEIIIAKHRNGSVGDVKLKFVGEFAKFEDYAQGPNDGNLTQSDMGAGFKSFQSKMNDDLDDDSPF
jgi:replicative DNA helicase